MRPDVADFMLTLAGPKADALAPLFMLDRGLESALARGREAMLLQIRVGWWQQALGTVDAIDARVAAMRALDRSTDGAVATWLEAWACHLSDPEQDSRATALTALIAAVCGARSPAARAARRLAHSDRPLTRWQMLRALY